MRRRRPLQFLAASTLAAGVLLTGCGGGGGDDAAADDTAIANVPAVTPAAGVGAIPTDVLYGSPEAAATHQVAESLPGFDQFGAPRDGFKQLVRETTGGSSGVGVPVDPSVTGTPPTAPAPATETTPTTTTTTPGTDVTPPVETALREADFDIGGEPIVARAGDAIPPGTQQFTVDEIRAASVVLKLNGGLLPDGSDTVTVEVGKSVTLYNQTSSTSYRVRLLNIRRIS